MVPRIKKYIVQKPWQIARDLLTVAISALGVYWGVIRYHGQVAITEGVIELNSNAEERIDELEKRNRNQRGQIENLSLVRASVENCLDVFPMPAFRKIYDVDRDVIFMDEINPAYVSRYMDNVSKSQYIGLADSVAHPKEVSLEYDLHDRKLLQTMGSDIFFEQTKVVGKTNIIWERFFKWTTKKDGKTYIYGVLLPKTY